MNEIVHEYDDDAELTRYIWSNYQHLLNEAEHLALKALLAEEKALAWEKHNNHAKASLLRNKWVNRDDSVVVELLKEGPDVFRDRVRKRILVDCRNEVFVNRCSRCERIVRTPKAEQCLWCGHDWHKAGGTE